MKGPNSYSQIRPHYGSGGGLDQQTVYGGGPGPGGYMGGPGYNMPYPSIPQQQQQQQIPRQFSNPQLAGPVARPRPVVPPVPGSDRGNYYPAANVPIVNRNPYQAPPAPLNPYQQGVPAPNGYAVRPMPPQSNYNPGHPINNQSPKGFPGAQYPMSATGMPVLPPLEGALSRKGHRQRPPTQQSSYPSRAPTRQGVRFPALKLHHELMHLDHSDISEFKPHPHYPDHMTTIRIRTPSQWGPSRLGTPTELRSTMSTIERYRLNPSKSAVSLEYEPYTPADYKTLISKYQHMKLPKSLGPTDDERWQREV